MPPTVAAPVTLWDCHLDYKRTYMALRNFAPATRRGYVSDLRLFIRYLTEEGGVNAVQAVERTHVHEYFAELDQRLLNVSRGEMTGATALRMVASRVETATGVAAVSVAGL